MIKHRMRRMLGLIFAAAILAFSASPPVQALERLPSRISLGADESLELSFGLPGSVSLANGEALNAVSGFDQPLRAADLTDGTPGKATLIFRLLGFLPLKTVSVSVEDNMPPVLIPGGHSLGVALLTEGVIVVGASDLGAAPSPARLAGLRAGDRIISVNGQTVESAGQLSSLVTDGQSCSLEIVRDEKALTLDITPARDPRDGSYRLGMWVRDSTAGIGTLTFYNPEDDSFGALGHAIADVDTGITLPVSQGGIYKSSVTDVNKGRQGAPGELLGQFFDADAQLGRIELNTDCGIFGRAETGFTNPLYPDGLPAAAREEVHPGPAQLLTTLTGGEITAYDCEIVRINRDDDASARSLLLEITDPGLLSETGGIVQGMSGSPIVQDGKLVGAVTHVLVNDPTRGYGIFIENMLEAARG